ncbi:DUF6088 family protein [Vibrio parahaemolyticus]|uniref:DUF6088 family protein n=1 Tax=Vibrio parahaemolyticus TaxID=670 RepID=UPI001B838461|nr:DUF6088 family protein [Vibrio parahaemolyticus]MCX8769179.1 DUF6088 family protein [Vibrio parahaemolyticus]MCX8784071.1 DUF6088 family protein [Vibrio parahaemolyticus]HBC3977541.1 hypothetical protein [Vibrio parahaemolyticus]
MSTAEKVRMNIRRMKPGTVFLVSDLPTYSEEKRATVKAVSYYASSEKFKEKYGSVNKIADGLYYKEEEGFLGKLPPSYDAVLYALTFVKNKKVGFVTGHKLFNVKGLSTQVPAITTVVTSKKAPTLVNIAGIKIEVIRKTKKIKENDIKRYEFEYILNNLERVQSIESEKISDSLSDYIELIKNDHRQFKELYSHLHYKKTKALLGALIEDYQEKNNENFESLLTEIKKDLSTRSKYRLGHLSSYINHRKEWNIEF